MTIAEYCVFGTLMLYLLTIAPIKWLGFRRFDNARPRDPGFYEDPIASRALGAHPNGIEACPVVARRGFRCLRARRFRQGNALSWVAEGSKLQPLYKLSGAPGRP